MRDRANKARLRLGERAIPEETAVALSYDRVAHAVMMATPSDLEDFAVGFSLSEGVIADPRDIEALGVVASEDGLELRMWIAEPRAGPSGCGLCASAISRALNHTPTLCRKPSSRVTPSSVRYHMAHFGFSPARDGAP